MYSKLTNKNVCIYLINLKEIRMRFSGIKILIIV